MYLRHIQRRKNGKEHSYWSLVESRWPAAGRVAQRHVLYLGEINDAQERATTDGRTLILSRYTQPAPDLQLLLTWLKLELPAQPPPRITAVSVEKEVPM